MALATESSSTTTTSGWSAGRVAVVLAVVAVTGAGAPRLLAGQAEEALAPEVVELGTHQLTDVVVGQPALRVDRQTRRPPRSRPRRSRRSSAAACAPAGTPRAPPSPRRWRTPPGRQPPTNTQTTGGNANGPPHPDGDAVLAARAVVVTASDARTPAAGRHPPAKPPRDFPGPSRAPLSRRAKTRRQPGRAPPRPSTRRPRCRQPLRTEPPTLLPTGPGSGDQAGGRGRCPGPRRRRRLRAEPRHHEPRRCRVRFPGRRHGRARGRRRA